MSFYTIWLIIPAIGGIAITVYQLVIKDVDTIWTSLYALLVCIWVTIFNERWKRKSAEICLKWGISDMIMSGNNENRVMREDFNGYEFFSQVSLSTVKKTFKPYRMMIVFILSIPVFIILIGAAVAAFFGYMNLKNYKSADNPSLDKVISTIAGIVNGIVIAIIDFLYSYLATWFVKLENHKY